MKKSEIYQRAIISVVDDKNLQPFAKLEIMRVLFEEENTALYCERKEAEKKEEQEEEF